MKKATINTNANRNSVENSINSQEEKKMKNVKLTPNYDAVRNQPFEDFLQSLNDDEDNFYKVIELIGKKTYHYISDPVHEFVRKTIYGHIEYRGKWVNTRIIDEHNEWIVDSIGAANKAISAFEYEADYDGDPTEKWQSEVFVYCHNIKFALYMVYGDIEENIAPFLDYCEMCLYCGKYIDLNDYEAISAAFEEADIGYIYDFSDIPGYDEMVEENNVEEENKMTSNNKINENNNSHSNNFCERYKELEAQISRGGQEFVDGICEKYYKEKWSDTQIILSNAEIRKTIAVLNKIIRKRCSCAIDENNKDALYQADSAYYDAAYGKCDVIKEALEASYNDYSKYGDINPFITYCYNCTYMQNLVDLCEYEKIRALLGVAHDNNNDNGGADKGALENEQEEQEMEKENNNSSNNTFNTVVEQPKTYLATTKTGHKIYICDETVEHMKAHSNVSIDHIKEAIEANDTYQGPFEIRMISLGYIVGKDRCVEVGENDPEVHQLYRKSRAGTTPVTFSKEAKDTSLITIGICLDEDLKDTLFTAFYGQLAPREPWDPSLSDQDRAESEAFWKNHAIVALPEEIDWERSDKKFMPKKQEEKKMENLKNANENANGNSVNRNNNTQEVSKMTRENSNSNTMVNNTMKKEESKMTNVNNTLSNSAFSAQMEKEIEEFEKVNSAELVEYIAARKREYRRAKEDEAYWERAIANLDRAYLDTSKSAEEKEAEARRDADERLWDDCHVLDRDEERCRMENIVRNGYEESKDSFWDEHMTDIQRRACNLMALCTIDKDIAANNTFYRKSIKNVPDGYHEVEVAVTAFRAPGLVDAAFWAPRLRANIDKIVTYQKQTQSVVIIRFPEIWAAFKAVVENYGIDNVPPVYKMLYTWYYDHATKEEKRDFEEYLPKAMNRFAWVYTTGKSSSKYPIYNVWRNIALGRNLNDAPDGVSPEFADKIRAYTDKAYALLFTEAKEYSDDELDDLEAKAMRYYREKFWEAKYMPKVGMDYTMLVKRASENEMAWKILDAFDDMTDAGAAEYAARVIKSRQAEMAKIRAQEPLRRYAEALINAMCEGLNDDQDYSKR